MSHNCSFFLTAGIAAVVDCKAKQGAVHITLQTQKVVQQCRNRLQVSIAETIKYVQIQN